MVGAMSPGGAGWRSAPVSALSRAQPQNQRSPASEKCRTPDGSPGDGLRLPAFARKQGLRTNRSRRRTAEAVASLAVGENQVRAQTRRATCFRVSAVRGSSSVDGSRAGPDRASGTAPARKPTLPLASGSGSGTMIVGGALDRCNRRLEAGLGGDLAPSSTRPGCPRKQPTPSLVSENATARLDGLRSSLSVMAIIALIALPFSRRIPTGQPASAPAT